MTIANNPSCPGCANQGSPTDKQTQDAGVTYDDGQGIKDKVVFSGPLSEVIAQTLALVFKKQELSTNQDGPDVPDVAAQVPATETYVQDVAIAAAFKEAAEKPDNQTILAGFDVASIKDHMARMLAETPTAADVQTNAPIPVIVMKDSDLLDPTNLMNTQLKSTDELLVVPVPDPLDASKSNDILLQRDPTNRITDFLKGSEYTPPKQNDTHMSVSDKVAAIERLYGDSVKKIHYGFEAFIQSLQKRSKL